MSRRIARSLAPLAVVLLVGFALAACGRDLERQQITLGSETLDVWVVDTPEERAEGLQAVDRIEEGEGMLFVWDGPGQRAFELKDLDYGVDVVFVGPDSRVTQVTTLQPGGIEFIAGERTTAWVVEVPEGWAERHDITPGDLLVRSR